MYEESLEDFKRRLQGTFVFLEFNNKEHLVSFHGTGSNDNLMFNSSKYGEVLINFEKARETVKYRFPETGLYNINNECTLVSRIANRQWKRAPCTSNMGLTPILKLLGHRYINDDIVLNEENLEQIYDPVYPKTILDGVAKLRTSVALSLDFGITLTNRNFTDEYLLWYRAKPIGYINTRTLAIQVNYKPLLQEVQDFTSKDPVKWSISLN